MASKARSATGESLLMVNVSMLIGAVVTPALLAGMTAISHFLKAPALFGSADMQQMYHWNMWPIATWPDESEFPFASRSELRLLCRIETGLCRVLAVLVDRQQHRELADRVPGPVDLRPVRHRVLLADL